MFPAGGKPRARNYWRHLALFSAISFGLAALYWAPLRLGVVSGQSMAPTLEQGQVFLMRRGRRIHRGDIVVLDIRGQKHIKRVYAVAGDKVSGIDWEETSGRPDYIAESPELSTLPDLLQRQPAIGRLIELTVPAGHVFVLGDALTWSYDSRHFGTVPIESISGRFIRSLFRLHDPGAGCQTVLALESEKAGPLPENPL